MLALISSGSFLREVAEGAGFDLPNGDRVSPAYHGWATEDEAFTLATIAPADDVPEGKRVASTAVQMIEGAPKYVHEIEDIPPPPIPDRVTARQFKLQLLAAGLIDAVEGWIATQDRAVQIAYANSGSFVRDEPMMQAGFAALGFTEQQGDEFFVAAAQL